MAVTPFATAAVSYAGQDPLVPQPWNTNPPRFWLGGAAPLQMIELPGVMAEGYTVSESMGEVEQGLAGGISGLTRFAGLTRRWTIPFQRLAGRDFQVVQGFYRRVICGNGPWIFLPPEDTNRLTLAQSLAGDLNDVAEGWVASAGTVAFDGTLLPPVEPCGVLRWSGAGSGSTLTAFGPAATNLVYSPPNVPALAWTGSVAVAGTAAASARAALVGLAADGITAVTTIYGTTTSISTNYATLTVSAAANAFNAGCAYVVLQVQCQTASAPNLLVSVPQLETNLVAGSGTFAPTPWSLGSGAPRVLWPAGYDRPIDRNSTSGATMTLAECVPNAA